MAASALLSPKMNAEICCDWASTQTPGAGTSGKGGPASRSRARHFGLRRAIPLNGGRVLRARGFLLVVRTSEKRRRPTERHIAGRGRASGLLGGRMLLG